jgi:hypothetical protein
MIELHLTVFFVSHGRSPETCNTHNMSVEMPDVYSLVEQPQLDEAVRGTSQSGTRCVRHGRETQQVSPKLEGQISMLLAVCFTAAWETLLGHVHLLGLE